MPAPGVRRGVVSGNEMDCGDRDQGGGGGRGNKVDCTRFGRTIDAPSQSAGESGQDGGAKIAVEPTVIAGEQEIEAAAEPRLEPAEQIDHDLAVEPGPA
jgi:hypothetical protein